MRDLDTGPYEDGFFGEVEAATMSILDESADSPVAASRRAVELIARARELYTANPDLHKYHVQYYLDHKEIPYGQTGSLRDERGNFVPYTNWIFDVQPE